MPDSAPYSRLANAHETRAVLEQFGLATKHRLGQNFLVSDEIIGRILDLAELDGDEVALEVGPGIGTLSVALLSRVRALCAIEADKTLVPVLKQTCATDSEKLALVTGDALRVSPDQIVDALAAIDVQEAPSIFVANLPYQVAARVILQFLQQLPTLRRCVVMVQAEVADRICAKAGSRTYSAYTAKLALFAQVTGRFEVGSSNFMPAPHVNSSVVRLDRVNSTNPVTHELLTTEQLRRTAKVIDAAFLQRRKTIRNSMSAAGFATEVLDGGFTAAKIDPRTRAEALTPDDFIRLAACL